MQLHYGLYKSESLSYSSWFIMCRVYTFLAAYLLICSFWLTSKVFAVSFTVLGSLCGLSWRCMFMVEHSQWAEEQDDISKLFGTSLRPLLGPWLLQWSLLSVCGASYFEVIPWLIRKIGIYLIASFLCELYLCLKWHCLISCSSRILSTSSPVQFPWHQVSWMYSMFMHFVTSWCALPFII